MAPRSLRISVQWLLGYGGLRVSGVDWRTGRDDDALPRDATRFYDRLSEWATLVRDHYEAVHPATSRTLRRDLARELGDRFSVTD